ncbi:MAG: CRISPR-associated endonuclease Cas1 [Desulfobacterales bacterium]|nr:CRISPR-associated endonuclease Cas1 [Desulfobacterales bacterium]
MQLVINTYGGYIRKKGECFEITVDEKKQEISAKKVQSILITTAVLISSDAILLANENNIDIIFLDQFGNPFSRVWHCKFGSTAHIRRKQLEFSENEKGVKLAKGWIIEKVENQIKLLEQLQKTRENKREDIDEYVKSISGYRDRLLSLTGNSIDEIRENIFSSEALSGKIYFETLSFIIPERYKFSGRSRNPAKDEFNAFLNYGYGVLYSKVERACILSGLDPYIGFLHTDNYGKKSFVFDIIEPFRYFVDELVIKLFSKRMVKQEMFRNIQNGLMLEKEGKQLLISEYNKSMEETIRYRGRNIKKNNIIEFECHRIANSFLDKNDNEDMETYEC